MSHQAGAIVSKEQCIQRRKVRSQGKAALFTRHHYKIIIGKRLIDHANQIRSSNLKSHFFSSDFDIGYLGHISKADIMEKFQKIFCQTCKKK